MSVRCKIECVGVGCGNTAEWDDEVPQSYAHGRHNVVMGSSANRSPPPNWVLRPLEPITGALAHKAKGICPECRRSLLTFDGNDPVGLWSRRLVATAIEPGVFAITQEDGRRYGEVRFLSRNATLIPGDDMPIGHLEVVARKIAERFELF